MKWVNLVNIWPTEPGTQDRLQERSKRVLFNIAKASFKLLELQSQVVRERAGMKRVERIFFPLRDIHTQEALGYYRRAIAADTTAVRKLASFANFLARS